MASFSKQTLVDTAQYIVQFILQNKKIVIAILAGLTVVGGYLIRKGMNRILPPRKVGSVSNDAQYDFVIVGAGTYVVEKNSDNF